MDLVNVANKVKQLRHQQKLTIDSWPPVPG